MIDPLRDAQFASSVLQAAQPSKKRKAEVSQTERSAFSERLGENLAERNAPLQDELWQEIQSLPKERALEVLTDSLTLAADDIKRNALFVSDELIENYKKAARNFLRFVKENAFSQEREIGKKISLPNGEKAWKQYQRIEVIDSRLEKLASEIFFNQRNQIKIIQTISDLTGLILNLAG